MLVNIIVIFEVLFRQFIWLVMPARRAQEILMLRKALQVLQRPVNRPRLNLWDRFFLSLFRLGHGVVDNVVDIKAKHSASLAPYTCRSQMDVSAETDRTTRNRR